MAPGFITELTDITYAIISCVSNTYPGNAVISNATTALLRGGESGAPL